MAMAEANTNEGVRKTEEVLFQIRQSAWDFKKFFWEEPTREPQTEEVAVCTLRRDSEEKC